MHRDNEYVKNKILSDYQSYMTMFYGKHFNFAEDPDYIKFEKIITKLTSEVKDVDVELVVKYRLGRLKGKSGVDKYSDPKSLGQILDDGYLAVPEDAVAFEVTARPVIRVAGIAFKAKGKEEILFANKIIIADADTQYAIEKKTGKNTVKDGYQLFTRDQIEMHSKLIMFKEVETGVGQ